MKKARIVDLREQLDETFDREALTADEAVAIASHPTARVSVGWPTPANGHRWILRATGWVGTLPVEDYLVLRITPKTPIPRLLELHFAAGGGRDLKLLSGLAPTAGVEEDAVSALRLLCERVTARMSRGLSKGYVAEIRSGSIPRGHLRSRDTVLQFARGRPNLVWDELPLTYDIDDNRILAWTLRRAARIAPVDPALTSEVVRLERALSASVTLRPYESSECRSRTYRRENADYAELHALCALVLDAIGPAAGSGSDDFLAFGVDVPTLFERAVAVTLAEALGPDLHLVTKPWITLGHGMAFNPDSVIEDSTGRALAVMDTKYKLSVLDSDVQQAVAYAAALGTDLAILIYPVPMAIKSLKAGAIRVVSMCFELDLPPLDAATALATGLRGLLQEP